MQNAQVALERLCDPASEVSAHYLICAQGRVTQMVDENMRAWHAGAGNWNGQGDVNSRSIGIELDNDGTSPFAAAQMDALEVLLRGIMGRWSIPAKGVIGHSDMAPGRKIDPGPRFDWTRLARQDLARQAGNDAEPQDPNMEMFRSLAAQAGYPVNADDAALLRAVRLRYRAHATGALAPEDFGPLGHCALWT